MKSDYLTLEELLYTLEHEGLDVQERTIRFWVAKGVLEKPVRKPYKFADGRKRYFPVKVVGEIADILRYQAEGWKLSQIKKRLRAPLRAKQSDLAESEELARRYLADYLGNGEFKDRVKMIESADPSTPEWRRVRNFLVARLTHLVGRKQAVKAVTSFMLGLSKRDVAKLLRRTAARPESVAESEPERFWSVEEVDRLKHALSSLEPPRWEEPFPEPVLSLRLRKALSDLRETVGSIEQTGNREEGRKLGRSLAALRSLQSELAASRALLEAERSSE